MIKVNAQKIMVSLIIIMALYNLSMLGYAVYPATGDIVKILFMFLCFFLFLKDNIFVNRRTTLFVFSMSICYFIVMFINGSSIINAIAIIMRFISCYVFCIFCFRKKIDWKKLLCDICYGIVFTYLILFIIFEVIPINFTPTVVSHNFYYGARDSRLFSTVRFVDYYHIYFRRQMISIGNIQLPRCSAFFSEPGIYQIIISYCLWYFFFISSKRELFKIVICLIGMLTSTSTMGLLIMMFFFVLYFLKMNQNVINRNNKIILFFFVIVGMFFLLWIGQMVLVWKSGTISMQNRVKDINTFYTGFKQYWLFGVGLNRYDFSSSGIWIVLSELGIFGLYIPISVIILIKKLSYCYDWIAGLGFGIWMFFSLLNEPCAYSDFFMLFVAYAFIEERENGGSFHRRKKQCLEY